MVYRSGSSDELFTLSLVWAGALSAIVAGFALLREFKLVGLTDSFVLLIIGVLVFLPMSARGMPVTIAGFFGIGAGIFISGQIVGSPEGTDS